MLKVSSGSNYPNISDQHYLNTSCNMWSPLKYLQDTTLVVSHPTMYPHGIITAQVILCLLQYHIDIFHQCIPYHVKFIFWFITSFVFWGVVLVVAHIHHMLDFQSLCWSHSHFNNIIFIKINPLAVNGAIFAAPNYILQYNTIKLPQVFQVNEIKVVFILTTYTNSKCILVV